MPFPSTFPARATARRAKSTASREQIKKGALSGASLPAKTGPLRRLLARGDVDGLLRTAVDRDGAGLLRLGHFTHQLDMQQTVLDGRLGRAHVVGKVEAALERARGDALVEHFALVGFALLGRLLGPA